MHDARLINQGHTGHIGGHIGHYKPHLTYTQLFFQLLQHVVFAKIALDEVYAVNWLHLQQIERKDQTAIANPLDRHLRPAPGRCSKNDYPLSTPQQLILVVYLHQLESGV